MIIGMLIETLSIGLIFPILTIISDESVILQYEVLKNLYNFFDFEDYKFFLFYCLIFLFFIFFVKAIYMFILSWLQNRFTFNFEADLCKNLYKIYLLKPYLFHTENNSSKLVQNFVLDSGILTYNIILPSLRLITESLVIIGLVTMLLFIEFKISLIVIAFLAILILIYYFSIKNSVEKWGAIRENLDGLRIKHLQQSFSALKEIKVMNKEDFFIKKFNNYNSTLAKYNRYQHTLLSFPYIGFEFLAVFAMIFFIFLLVLQGSEISSVIPILGLFAGVGFRLIPSLNRLVVSLQLIKFGKPSIDKLILGVSYEEKENYSIINNKISNDFEKIEFKNLSFKYANKNNIVIDDISLSFVKNEIIGLYGESGSGKSTFLDILLGLIEPTSGKIYIDNLEIKNLHKRFDGNISYVPQMINLLDDTIENNIILGEKKQDYEDNFSKAIKVSKLQDVINGMSLGKDSFIGERGIKLSGGQRQRIGIARAIYFNPDILVLDEATNSLDENTEKLVLEELKKIKSIKLIFIVSHSSNGLLGCDRVLKIQNGKIKNIKNV